MLGLALWICVVAIGIGGVVVSANSLRFGRRLARDARQMWAASSAEPPRIDRRRLEELPAPVRRYLTKAIGQRELAVRTVRLRHGGVFRPKLDGPWLPIRGEQYFAADPPGFVWWGRVRIAPGLWVEARDRSVAGVGNMLIMLESTVTLADVSGRELDEAALHRLLGEMAWFPTALLDDRYVRWALMDDRRARATLQVNGRAVEGIFALGDDDLPVEFHANRYRDLGGGKSALTPFAAHCGDYREVDGLLVPHEMTASWIVGGKPLPYVRFRVERMEFDAAAPFQRLQ